MKLTLPCACLQFTQENEKAQKYLLGGFEQLVGNVYPSTLMVKVPHILKAFYDADILDEDTLIEWDKKVGEDCFCVLPHLNQSTVQDVTRCHQLVY